ncbi:transmembrane sensor domain protein [Candidatus Magnetobacterium bavaricum]|uniref:Transmembrane sensor domain protein n=1 Tax=Candidatus Magnetobacterium bavaricum TaxID=29290 RepID=A0A0F3H039_9BACT|nr:transmembrane sensor domain protein [Candidatus Magnetobacterium bavaricum]
MWKSETGKGNLSLLILGVGLSLICTLIVIYPPVFMRFIGGKLYDVVLMSVHSSKTSGIPVIIDIDDKSMLQYGQWPWPRYRVALLLERLKSLGVTAVGIDIVFSEQDRTSPSVLKHTLKADLDIDVDFTNMPEALMDYDKVLANTLRRGPFVLGYKFMFEDQSNKHQHGCRLHPLKAAIIDTSDSMTQTNYEPSDVLCNQPLLSEAANGSGFFNAASDRDGIFRRVPLVTQRQGRYYPNLALATFLYSTGSEQVIIKRDRNGIESIRAGAITIPVDATGNMLVHYRGGRKVFPFYSAVDIMLGKIPQDMLEGKIAFVGSSALGLMDIRSTPFDQFYPGVEVHATVVDTILTGNFISAPGWVVGAEVLITLLLGLVSTVLFVYMRIYKSVPVLILIMAALWFGTKHLMLAKGVYLSPLVPFLTLNNTFMVLTILKFRREEADKRFLHRAFSKYVSGAVVDELVKNPQQLTLQGEEKNVTILFSDIRGFTTISEQMCPTDISSLLRGYFTPMTAIVKDNKGTLDKFIGDAIMAFWNAPVSVDNHEGCAVTAALEMLSELKGLNVEFKTRFGLDINIGIGLHSGVAMVGNMGSQDMFNYTIIGDNVNLASRIEGLTKTYGLSLLVSEAIQKSVDAQSAHKLRFVEIDRVRVKGKQQPVTLYTAYAEGQVDEYEEEITLFTEALSLYYALDFFKAGQLFSRLMSGYRQVVLYDLYRRRCNYFQLNVPDKTWDKVFTHTLK